MFNKTAIFVEGQTELIFVREMLLKLFEYQNIHLECYTLFTDSRFIPTEYAFPNRVAEYHYHIINVGNDKSLLKRILNREKFLWNAGFHKIIGLRDMYSKEYREASLERVVDKDIINQFTNGYRNQIKSKNIHFHFAIMEIEAWLLGMKTIFTRINASISDADLCNFLNLENSDTDPEYLFFKPSNEINTVMNFIGIGGYDKSKSSINSIVSYIKKEDFIALNESIICNSFSEFYNSVMR